MTVALIACSNGYGHIRRLVILAEALKAQGAIPTIFAPLAAVRTFQNLYKVQNLDVEDFPSRTSINDWINGRGEGWIGHLPDISKYTWVVSDNLIEVLRVRKDAIISGTFFWHESLMEYNNEAAMRAQALLADVGPRVISSKLFVTKQFKANNNPYEVGLYHCDTYSSVQPTEKTDALVSCGKGGACQADVKVLVRKLVEKSIEIPYNPVWVEPSILPRDNPPGMLKATYTAEMYSKILAAIIRPGVGTATDSIVSGAKVFAFYEKGNFEMGNNALALEENGLAMDCKGIETAWEQAKIYYRNSSSQSQIREATDKINKNGAVEAASLILGKV